MSKIMDHPNFQILLNTILSTVKYDSFLTAIFLLAAGDIFKIPPGIQLLFNQTRFEQSYAFHNPMGILLASLGKSPV